MLSSFFTNKIHTATENFNKKTHGPILPIRLAYVISKMANFYVQSRRCRVTVLGKLFTPIVPLFTKQQNW